MGIGALCLILAVVLLSTTEIDDIASRRELKLGHWVSVQDTMRTDPGGRWQWNVVVG
jgi:hypothetical protein